MSLLEDFQNQLKQSREELEILRDNNALLSADLFAKKEDIAALIVTEREKLQRQIAQQKQEILQLRYQLDDWYTDRRNALQRQIDQIRKKSWLLAMISREYRLVSLAKIRELQRLRELPMPPLSQEMKVVRQQLDEKEEVLERLLLVIPDETKKVRQAKRELSRLEASKNDLEFDIRNKEREVERIQRNIQHIHI